MKSPASAPPGRLGAPPPPVYLSWQSSRLVNGRSAVRIRSPAPRSEAVYRTVSFEAVERTGVQCGQYTWINTTPSERYRPIGQRPAGARQVFIGHYVSHANCPNSVSAVRRMLRSALIAGRVVLPRSWVPLPGSQEGLER